MKENNNRAGKDIAIIGMGCLFPDSPDLEHFWNNIKQGKDSVKEIPASHWRPEDYYNEDPSSPDMTYAKRGAFLSGYKFNPLKYGILPDAIEATDTSQLLAMAVAQDAMEHAGYGLKDDFDRDRVSCIMGITGALELVIPLGARLGHPIWKKALLEAGIEEELANDVVERIKDKYVGWQENSFPGLLGNVAAGRVANRLDLGGTNTVCDSACGSSLSAVHLAVMELQTKRSDMVITGGIDTFNDIFMYMCFSKTPALSKTGNSKPFSANGDGTILGEGIGAVILKRLEDAERDGDKVFAVIKGVGTSSDGKGQAIYAPAAKGQKKCLNDAYTQGDVDPSTIELIEAHGTGTKVGDKIELTALTEIYRDSNKDSKWCAIGSVKSQIGHTKAAAGAAGLIKAGMALHHKVLPPTIKIDEPAPVLADSPFYANCEAKPWVGRFDTPRRAGVSAFGFGGSNFHCALEEYSPTKTSVDWNPNIQLLTFSGENASEVSSKVSHFQKELSDENANYRALAKENRASFNGESSARLIIVAQNKEDAFSKLSKASEQVSVKANFNLKEGIFFESQTRRKNVGALFAGQGSQFTGMLRDLACQFPEFIETLQEADKAHAEKNPNQSILSDLIYPFSRFNDTDREKDTQLLTRTENAQPALGAVSLASYDVINKRFGLTPFATGGHSYGEIPALYAAGVVSRVDAARLSCLRGKLMGTAGDDLGTMAAVLTSKETCEAVLNTHSLNLTVANHNTPDQVVISGSHADIKKAQPIFEAEKIRFIQLPVGAAFHSKFVEGASKPFFDGMKELNFQSPQIPVYTNTGGVKYNTDPNSMKKTLSEQLANQVSFVDQVQRMKSDGCEIFVEFGPGKKLQGMVKKIVGRDTPVISIDASSGKQSGQFDLGLFIAELACHGVNLNLSSWDSEFKAPEKEKGPQMFVEITGANYRKPDDINKPARPPIASAAKTDPAPVTTHAAVQNKQVTNNTFNANNNATSSKGNFMTQQNNQGLMDALRMTQESLLNLQRLQQQNADLHRTFLEGQNRTQEVIQTLLIQQSGLMSGHPVSLPTPAPIQAAPVSTPAQYIPSPVTQVPTYTPAPTQTPVATQPTASQPIAQQPTPSPVSSTPARPAQAAQPAQPAQPATSNSTMAQDLLKVVSEKTGYPTELLNLEMNLETDLGIDSIKRVEILSSIQDLHPHLDEFSQEELNSLSTLQDICDSLDAQTGSNSQNSAPAPIGAASTTPSGGNKEVMSSLLSVISEKTGYPQDMLSGEMQLETDLGIDSIKRVEIFSALQEIIPSASSLSPETMSSLRTLDEIASTLGGATSVASTPAVSQPATATPVNPTSGATQSVRVNIQDSLIEVISEKTGYPKDMLSLEMQLETDLGIDSIKRVEIFSALQEKVPEAGDIPPEKLGSLGSLSEIVDFLSVAEAAPKSETSAVKIESARVSTVTATVPSTLDDNLECLDTFDFGIERIEVNSIHLKNTNSQVSVSPKAGSQFWINEDGGQLSKNIASSLESKGFKVRLVNDAYIDRMKEPEALDALIIVAPEKDVGESNVLSWFKLAKLAGEGLVKSAASGPSFFATVSRLGGEFGFNGISQENLPITGAMAGLTKTASHEWDGVICKAIDVDSSIPSKKLATKVLDEVFKKGFKEVGIKKDGFSVTDLKEQAITDIDETTAPLKKDDVVIVTGGAKGVTSKVALALAKKFKPTLVLLGRSPAPENEPSWMTNLTNEAQIKTTILQYSAGKMTPKDLQAAYKKYMGWREIRATIEGMENAGSKVIYRSVDVRDEKQLKNCLDNVVSEHGPIRGFVHGAGVLADRFIKDKTIDQFEMVYKTKVEGYYSIMRALEPSMLTLLVMFSSSTGRYGRKGQVDYAMSNEILNKEAQWHRSQYKHCKVVSVNWGPWDGGMVNDSLKRLFNSEGVGVIPLKGGSEYLVGELLNKASAPSEIVILGKGTDLRTLAPKDGLNTQNLGKPNSEGATVSVPASSLETTQVKATTDNTPVMIKDISVKTDNFLKSHVIGSKAVLPAALMMEWLTAAVLKQNPGKVFVGINDFKVYKGVLLTAEDTAGLQFFITKANRTGQDQVCEVVMKTHTKDGKEFIHCGGSVLLADKLPEKPSPKLQESSEACDFSATEIYGSKLFHGSDFKGIRDIRGISKAGASAEVKASPHPMLWMNKPVSEYWLLDPLSIDCCFQLMILWTQQNMGASSLPAGFKSYRQFRKTFPKKGVLLNIEIKETRNGRAISDIEFIDGQGRLVAVMEGYECTVNKALEQSFHANSLS